MQCNILCYSQFDRKEYATCDNAKFGQAQASCNVTYNGQNSDRERNKPSKPKRPVLWHATAILGDDSV